MAPKRKAATESVPEAEAENKKAKSKSGLEVGDDFPNLGPIETEESTDSDKKTVDLTALLKSKGVILFFYPRANTPGCTTQACGLRNNYEKITAAGYELFGMSADKPKSQANWKDKNKFPYHLLCDPSFELLKKLGVAKGGTSVNRSHIIVNKGGKVAAVEYGISPKLSIEKVAAFAEASTKAPKGKASAAAAKEAKAEANGKDKAETKEKPAATSIKEAKVVIKGKGKGKAETKAEPVSASAKEAKDVTKGKETADSEGLAEAEAKSTAEAEAAGKGVAGAKADGEGEGLAEDMAEGEGEMEGMKPRLKSGLEVGDDFPNLGPIETEESTESNKKTVDLTELLKSKGVILFFYPKANTPGCTTQACGLRDNYEGITAAGYELFGMSADKPKSQANWKVKHKFPYHLLCDPSLELLKKLGVAKGSKSVNRSHIIINKGGKVAAVEYGISPKLSIEKVKAFAEAAN